MHPEQLEASFRYGAGQVVRRVNTRCDVSTIRAVYSKLRRMSQRIEAGEVTKPHDLLHDIWKCMDWLPDAFTPGFRALINRPHYWEREGGEKTDGE